MSIDGLEWGFSEEYTCSKLTKSNRKTTGKSMENGEKSTTSQNDTLVTLSSKAKLSLLAIDGGSVLQMACEENMATTFACD